LYEANSPADSRGGHGSKQAAVSHVGLKRGTDPPLVAERA